MGIGKTLSKILNEKGSNANELAMKINVAPTTIYSILKRDNTKVDIEVLIKICRALNVKVERFYQEYLTEDELKYCEENTSVNNITTDSLTTNKRRILDLFDMLDEVQQENVIARAELYAEQNNESENKDTG